MPSPDELARPTALARLLSLRVIGLFHRTVIGLLLVVIACSDSNGSVAATDTTAGQTSADGTGAGTDATTTEPPTMGTSTSATDVTSSQEGPVEPPETCGYGRFRAAGDVSGDFDWTDEANLVRCTEREDVEGWLVRLAEDPASDGTAGLHLDLSLYLYDGEGNYLPLPYPQWPPDPRTFDLFLRSPSGAPHYANVPTSTDCATTVTYADAQWIAGTFQCSGLVYFGAAPDLGRTVDVGDGAFCCEKPGSCSARGAAGSMSEISSWSAPRASF